MEIQIIKGDITEMTVDVIVNAANTSLLGGGGVDGAIHRAGGPIILEECRTIRSRQGGCKVGEAVITSAGNLKAQFVIHTVGPKWNAGKSDEAEKLKSCYENSLELAEKHGVSSIAFPGISTGIYGYPKSEAASIALATIANHKVGTLNDVFVVCFDEESYEIYNNLFNNRKD